MRDKRIIRIPKQRFARRGVYKQILLVVFLKVARVKVVFLHNSDYLGRELARFARFRRGKRSHCLFVNYAYRVFRRGVLKEFIKADIDYKQLVKVIITKPCINKGDDVSVFAACGDPRRRQKAENGNCTNMTACNRHRNKGQKVRTSHVFPN